MSDTPKHSHIPSEPQNEVTEPPAPAAEAVDLNAGVETPQHESGPAHSAVRVAPDSGASTHPTG